LPDAASGYAPEAPVRIPVEVDPDAEAAFSKLEPRAAKLIVQALSLDPRPATAATDEQRVFGADLCGANVKFRVIGGICRIIAIEGG